MSGNFLQVILLIFGLSLALVTTTSQKNVRGEDEDIEEKIVDAIDQHLPPGNETVDDATLGTAVNQALQQVLESAEDEHSKVLTKRGWFKKKWKKVENFGKKVATAVAVYKGAQLATSLLGKRQAEKTSELGPER